MSSAMGLPGCHPSVTHTDTNKSTSKVYLQQAASSLAYACQWPSCNPSHWLAHSPSSFTHPLTHPHSPHSKVYEKLCDDFGSKRRERVVRLDVPLRAFDGPTSTTSTSSSSSRPGACRLTATAAAGTFVGPGGTALAAGLDDLCAGLRDSIRAAFETRKMAYDAEVSD